MGCYELEPIRTYLTNGLIELGSKKVGLIHWVHYKRAELRLF